MREHNTRPWSCLPILATAAVVANERACVTSMWYQRRMSEERARGRAGVASLSRSRPRFRQRAWLDVPSAAATPPEGDLPDDFATRSAQAAGLWTRLRRALTRGSRRARADPVEPRSARSDRPAGCGAVLSRVRDRSR